MATKKNSLVFGTRVGLLGGGQLARMLALKGHELGLEMHVLSSSAQDPAAQVTSHWTQGDPHRLTDLKKFFRKVDLVTTESEFLNADLLEKAARSTLTPLFPEPDVLARLQDRLPQKRFMDEFGLPTSPFLAVNSVQDLEDAQLAFGNSFVLKKRQGGYDGYGTWIVRKAADFSKVRKMVSESRAPFIAEAFVTFRRELALVMVRSCAGECLALPLVETHQVDSRLDWLKGPIRHPKVTKLQNKIRRALDDIGYVGVIAFELFETRQGDLLINEIAPRVHNSGHASLEALEADQFRLHLMAILGLPLHVALKAPAFAMVNLIGQGNTKPSATKLTGHLHWYGKAESRQGRKMGHLTFVGRNADQLLKQALKEREGMKR